MNPTPEIQARIERIDRVISLLKTVPSIGMVGANEIARVAILELCALRSEVQVPAEAKEEPDSDLIREAEACVFAWLPEGTPDPEPLIYAYRAGYLKAARARLTPEPGLDYERLFEVLGEDWKSYVMDKDGGVGAFWDEKPGRNGSVWHSPGRGIRLSTFLRVRNLPADWTQSLRVREPKPEPDVEPDEGTPRLTEVEYMAEGKSAWEPGVYLGREAPFDGVSGWDYTVLSDRNIVQIVPRCRLRREGK